MQKCPKENHINHPAKGLADVIFALGLKLLNAGRTVDIFLAFRRLLCYAVCGAAGSTPVGGSPGFRG